MQFSIQLHNCKSSLSITLILCILHVSLKMRIPHYARQRIINLWKFCGNSGEFWGNPTKNFSFAFTRFPRCEIHFPQDWGDRIPLVSLVATMKTGENYCEKREREFPFHFISPPPPPHISFNCTLP